MYMLSGEQGFRPTLHCGPNHIREHVTLAGRGASIRQQWCPVNSGFGRHEFTLRGGKTEACAV
jgi:hypothetical protein